MNIFNLVIPWYVRWLAIAMLCVSAAGFGWVNGADSVQKKWDDHELQSALAAEKDKAERADITAKSAAQADMNRKLIQRTAQAIADQLEIKYVTPSDDAKCVVPVGVFRMRNDTAATYVPVPHGTR